MTTHFTTGDVAMQEGQVVDLQPLDPEYQEVYKAFTTTITGASHLIEPIQIVNIQRVQNPALYAQYAGRKKIMEKENPNIQIERWLFHECLDESVVKNIYRQGFNRSIASSTCKYSHCYTIIVLCNVTLPYSITIWWRSQLYSHS